MVENERKFVLDVKNPEGFKNMLMNMPTTAVYEYRQGYLNDHTRIREIKHNGEVVDALFTFKKKINGKLREVEKSIPQDDFDALWTDVNKVINKLRVKVMGDDGYTWEVDFFIDQATREFYLVMAEVELPDGMEMPPSVPSFIADNLLYLVPKTDLRFMNTQLVQPKLVKKTLEDLKNGKFHA
jgi:CYTH domain-containing protein